MKSAIDDLFISSRTGLPTTYDRKQKRYRVRFMENGKKLCPDAKFHLKREAEAYRDEMTIKFRQGTYVSADKGEEPFCDYADRWYENQGFKGTTAVRIKWYLENCIKPHFEGKRLKDIDHLDAQGWLTKMEFTLSDSTLERVFGDVKAIFTSAVRDKKIPDNPFDGITAPKAGKKRVEVLPALFVDYLFDSMPDEYRAMLALGAGNGLRMGEVLGMEVRRLNFLNRTGPETMVRQQLCYLPGEPLFLGPPKTDSSVRDIPMGDELKWALSEHLRKYPATETTMEYRPRKPKKKKKKGERRVRGEEEPEMRTVSLVFSSPRGGPVRRATFDRAWWKARDEACERYVASFLDAGDRIKAKEFVERLGSVATFHDLRHFFASLQIAKGTGVKAVQEYMGHASPMLTLNTYTHLWPGDGKTARSAVDDVLGGFRSLRAG